VLAQITRPDLLCPVFFLCPRLCCTRKKMGATKATKTRFCTPWWDFSLSRTMPSAVPFQLLRILLAALHPTTKSLWDTTVLPVTWIAMVTRPSTVKCRSCLKEIQQHAATAVPAHQHKHPTRTYGRSVLFLFPPICICTLTMIIYCMHPLHDL